MVVSRSSSGKGAKARAESAARTARTAALSICGRPSVVVMRTPDALPSRWRTKATSVFGSRVLQAPSPM